MAGKKPGPDPTGRKVKKVSVALRPEHVDALQRLALERVFSAQSKAGVQEAWKMVFERGERPSVSSAIRSLIDKERHDRLIIAWGAWIETFKPADGGPSPPDPAELLRYDFVFGAQGLPPLKPDEYVFRDEYMTRLARERRSQDESSADFASWVKPPDAEPEKVKPARMPEASHTTKQNRKPGPREKRH